MAKIFGQLEKAQLENTTSDTASHPKGMVTYRTDLNQAKVSNGTTYKLLIDEDSTQTLSNKTYASPITSGAITAAQTTTPANPSSGSNKLYFKADGKLYTLDSSGNEAMVGSGTGGVNNLITNGNADDTSSSIFVPYADSGTRPTDGTGGSPTVTTSVTTSSPLDGTKSYLLTKPASNVQGQGWAVPFSVDLAYRAKSLKISADFIVNSGTFVAGSNGSSPTDGDLIWTIYDVTNSQIIEPSNIKMFSNSSSLSDKFEATFQSSATGSSYRLIAHVASTSALAFELKVDNVTVSPQTYVYGTLVTDWVSFTPTGSWSTNTTYSGFWRRVGDSIEVAYNLLLSGAPTAAPLTVNLPTGLSIDVSKIAGGVNGSVVFPSGGIARDNGSIDYPIRAGFNSTTSLAIYVANSSSTYDSNNQVSNTVPVTFGSPDNIWVSATNIPIVGWSSSVQMSDSADTRVVTARIYKNGTQTYSSQTKLTSWTIDSDKTGMWDATNNRFNIASAGDYEIFSSLYATAATTSDQQFAYKINGGASVYVGNAPNTSGAINASFGGSDIIPNLKSGDYVEVFGFANASVTLQAGVAVSRVSLKRISGPTAIAASEKVSILYQTDSGQSLTSGGSTIIYEDKLKDSHNAYNPSTGVFTAPRSGDLKIAYSVASLTVADSEFTSAIQRNGATVVRFSSVKNPSLSRVYPSHTTCIPVVAGDQVKIINFDAHAGASVYASAADNTLAMWMD